MRSSVYLLKMYSHRINALQSLGHTLCYVDCFFTKIRNASHKAGIKHKCE